MQHTIHTQYDMEEDVAGPMLHAILCWVKLGDYSVREHVSLLTLPFPMLLQHPLDCHSADVNHLIMIITHTHAHTGITRCIHSIYSKHEEHLLHHLYQYLQFWLCCSHTWAVKRSMLEFYEPEIQLWRRVILFATQCRRRWMKKPAQQSSNSH